MTKDEQLDAAREFARRVIQESWDSAEVNGGDIEEWASELGLIFSRKATDEEAESIPDVDAGDNIFVFEEWMQMPSPADGIDGMPGGKIDA